MKMILNISPFKSAIASIFSAATGSFYSNIINVSTGGIEVFFQYVAWIVAAIAGIVSIINGIIRICEYFRLRKERK